MKSKLNFLVKKPAIICIIEKYYDCIGEVKKFKGVAKFNTLDPEEKYDEEIGKRIALLRAKRKCALYELRDSLHDFKMYEECMKDSKRDVEKNAGYLSKIDKELNKILLEDLKD